MLVYSLNFNVRLADMKVDNVLGVLCFAGIAMGSCASMTLKARVFCALPILGMLAIIKNSGLIYCVFMAMPLVYAVLCEKQTWRIKLAQCGAMLITPLSLTYLWKCHVAMVFSNGNMSRHSASLDYMMQVYKSKTSEELLTILNNYMSIWFSTSSSRNGSAEWMVIFLFIGMLGLGVCVRKRLFGKGNSEGVIALAVLGGYISYKIALLGMYLFNMPDEDALGMGSYLRYTDSVLIILFLCMVMYFLSLLRDLNNSCGVKCKIEKTFVICLGVFMVAALPWTRPQYFKDLIRPDYENDGCYRQLLQIQQENHLPKKNGRVLVYTHTQYSGFYVEYCFRSPDAYSVNAESIDRAFTQTPDYYDYLVVLDHDELIDEVLMKYGYPTDVKCITLNRNEE